MEVARKILILARETGAQMELDDIWVENLIPEEARDAQSVGDFLKILKKYDSVMSRKVAEAEDHGQKLRYIAEYKDGQARVTLQAVTKDHPFFQLHGSDNIVAVYSNYYETPLVIKGPGAGADVTAAGVFADVLRIAAG